MTTFGKLIGPVLAKALLAALVVTATFATPLQARESRAGDRQTEQSVGSTIPRIEPDRSIAVASPPRVRANALESTGWRLRPRR